MTEAGQRTDRPNTLEEEAARALGYDEGHTAGYDEGQSAIWTKIVCSVCGRNHDADESAACEGSQPVQFAEWVDAIHETRLTKESGLALMQDAARWSNAYMRERNRIFELRRAMRLAESHLPDNPESAMRVIERAYAADEELEQEVQNGA